MSIYDIIAQSFYALKQQCFTKIKIQEALKGKNKYPTDRSTRTEGFGLTRAFICIRSFATSVAFFILRTRTYFTLLESTKIEC